MKSWHCTAALALAAALTACSERTTGTVSLSLSSLAAPGTTTPAIMAAGDSTVITMGNDTVILRSVELVVREVELKKVEAAECDSVPDNGDCEEFETAPFLVALPLGAAAATTEISVQAPVGLFDRLDFDIHKVDAVAEAAFVAAHPGFGDISIKVTGTFSQAGTRSDFSYITDLNASERAFLAPPLSVIGDGTTNVTLRFDVSAWFLNAGKTALVDPASGNTGQANENLVKDNIEASFEAFRDNNHDGRDDMNEGS